VASMYGEIPGVLGPELETRRFAEIWAATRPVRWEIAERQRIYALDRVIFPTARAPGNLRAAVPEDLPWAVEWMDAFTRETGLFAPDNLARFKQLIGERSLHVWEDGGPKSMVAAPAFTPRGARIGYVYTPPALRARGYASVAVAALSEALLRAGRSFCFLYTDLANPTSNSIYAKIGYRPVSDAITIRFRDGKGEAEHGGVPHA